MDENAFMILDIFILGLGCYLLYAWYLVKFKGEVKENLFLAREYPLKKCKDKNGYLAYIAPRLLIFALVSVAAGVIGIADDCLGFLGGYYMILSLCFFAAAIWFAFVVKKCYKLFW